MSVCRLSVRPSVSLGISQSQSLEGIIVASSVRFVPAVRGQLHLFDTENR